MNAYATDHHHAAWASSFGAELQTSTNATPGEHSAPPPENSVTQVVGNGSGNVVWPDNTLLLTPVSHSDEGHSFPHISDSTTLDHHPFF